MSFWMAIEWQGCNRQDINMNPAVFQSYLTPQWQLHLPKSRSEAAESIATAYHISNIGQTTTPFAAPLISANKSLLKTFIELSLDINFYGGQIMSTVSVVISAIRGAVESASQGSMNGVSDAKRSVDIGVQSLVSTLPGPLAFIGPIISGLVSSVFDKLFSGLSGKIDLSSVTKCIRKLEGIIALIDVAGIAYAIMSVGFCLYWLTAKMSPVPPMPPCIAPTVGTTILIPGLPLPLNSNLKTTFSNSGNSVAEAVQKFYNNLSTHQLSIIGIYTGIIPFFPSPIPGPPIPWFSMLNIPFPNFGTPRFMRQDGGGTSGTSGTNGTIVQEPKLGEGELKAKMKQATDGLRDQSKQLKVC